MRWRRASSGLLVPGQEFVPPGICTMFAATHLCGFGAGGTIVPVQPLWNSADKDANCTLSNGDRTASFNNDGSVRSTTSRSSGKWYVEGTCDAGGASNNWRLGIALAAMTITLQIGDNSNSWAYLGAGNKRFNGSSTSYGNANANSDVMMMALDLDVGKIWFGENGTYYDSGDPAAATNEAFSGISGDIFLAFCGVTATRTYTLTTLGSYVYSPPTGFLAGF